MKTRRVIGRRCPNCHDLQQNLSVMGVDGEARARKAGAGDVTVCVNCGLIEVFTDSMLKRKVTVEEISKYSVELKGIIVPMVLHITQRGRIR